MAKIGVLALQGDVSEHVLALERAGKGKIQVIEVRKSGQMEECAALVLPGGESTTICRQLESSGLTEELKAAALSGKPILATCAGLVLISQEIMAITRASSNLWASWTSRSAEMPLGRRRSPLRRTCK